VNVRILHLLAATVALVLAVGGVAVAAGMARGTSPAKPAALDGATTDQTSDEDTTTQPRSTEAEQEGTKTYPVADAGTVTVTRDGTSLTVDAADAAPGWSHDIERASGREVEVTFRRNGRRVDFKAEIEDDHVKVRVRDRDDDQSAGSDDPASAAPMSNDDAATEDRPPRTEVREKDGRREVRREVEQQGTQTYPAADAGTVTVTRNGPRLTIDTADAAPGWNHDIERASGREVEVTFRRNGRRVDFKAEIEGTFVKVGVREREG